MDARTAQKRISAASNLDELLETLQEIEVELAELAAEHYQAEPTTVDQLIDVAGLPTYGGSAPGETEGVWSWDSGRLLVGEGSWAECKIVERVGE